MTSFVHCGIMGFKNSNSKNLIRQKTYLFDEIHALYANLESSGFRRYPFIDELQLFLTLFKISGGKHIPNS
tara:strand:+ start:180 stop:392 length:213 start_codon:yes stop_codon:yes gene_type:complete